MSGTLIEDLMATKVISVAPDCSVVDVVSKIHAYRISCLIVCEQDVPVGVISERDLVGFLYRHLASQEQDPASVDARDIMSSPVLTLEAAQSLNDALAFAQEHRIRHIPVVSASGLLVGLLTQTDLLRAAAQH